MYIDILARKIISRLFLATASPLLTGRSDDPLPIYPAGVGLALFDGATNCTFPAPAPYFDSSKFVGPNPSAPAVWYQIAASQQPFEAGCTCMYAKYALPASSSSSSSPAPSSSFQVENFCTRNGTVQSSVHGVALSTAPRYGSGTFQIQIEHAHQPPGGRCGPESPNLVVVKAYEEDEEIGGEGEKRYATVILGERNFDGFYLLSRERDWPRTKVNTYLKDVASLGFNLSQPYSLADQGPHCSEPEAAI
ncbi:hypothetical protein OC842_005937 [Tilletia horrida]|uniref:Uncharacterized protein n=1 Tax=Tilletia horrida TaxID=155126 RepID=A0AAN6JII4_9BASI|nr:hypothetical protein OC842_005937 [Tilletia horrida]